MDVTYARYQLPRVPEGQGCSLRLPLVATGLASGLPPLEICGTLIATTLVSFQPGSHDSRVTPELLQLCLSWSMDAPLKIFVKNPAAVEWLKARVIESLVTVLPLARRVRTLEIVFNPRIPPETFKTSDFTDLCSTESFFPVLESLRCTCRLNLWNKETILQSKEMYYMTNTANMSARAT